MINWIASYKTPPPDDREFVGMYHECDGHGLKILCESSHDRYYEVYEDSKAMYPIPHYWAEVSELGFPDVHTCLCECCDSYRCRQDYQPGIIPDSGKQ